MRLPAVLAVAALVSACSINLTLPEGLVDAAKQAAGDARIVSQSGSLEEKPVVFPSPEPTPPSTPLPVPSELQETPTPEPTTTIDCKAIQAEILAEERKLLNSPRVRGAAMAGQTLDLKADYDEIYAKFYAKYPTAECIRTPAPEQPAQ